MQIKIVHLNYTIWFISSYDLGSFCAMRPMTFENKRKKNYLEMNTAKREIFSNQP